MKVRPCFIALALICATSLVQAATWIEVEERGSTVEEAKQNCFNSAIRRVVGELVISDTEVSGDTVSREFIGGHSAGYVEDYEVQATYHENNQVILHMNVNVASSKIAERMRTNSNHRTTLSGDRLDTKVESILDQRFRGDRILSNVLSSYPHNAYIINGGQTEATIGIRRQVYIDVPYEIRWSRYWLDALVESINEVALESKSCKGFASNELEKLSLTVNAYKFFQDKICGRNPDITISRRNPNEWMINRSTFYFPDLSTVDIINSELRSPIGQPHVGLVVDLKDAGGNVIGTRCANIPTEPLISFAKNTQEVESIHGITPRPQIHGEIGIAGTVRIDARGLNLSRVSRVDMHLEKTCS